MRLKHRLLALLSAAFVCLPLATSVSHAQDPDPDAVRYAHQSFEQTQPVDLGEDMKLYNASPRIFHLNLPGKLHQLAPLQSLTFTGEEATKVRELLDGKGALKPFVEDGSIVVDDKFVSPPPAPPVPPAAPSAETTAPEAAADSAPTDPPATPPENPPSSGARRGRG